MREPADALSKSKPLLPRRFSERQPTSGRNMNLKTAASRLSVHYQTAYKLVRSGSLAAVKIGGTYEVSEAALERYRAERELLRSAAGTPREETPIVHRDREMAVADVRAVAQRTTT